MDWPPVAAWLAQAEEANNLRQASEILLEARDVLSMPFYAVILDGERRRIDSK
ncbi:MAG: hypothetical protein OEM15_18655 [Myxococcales bacterium]|nr:hypothetical protein [Myxococcales bacterium]MDH3485069.1 hypothetical protein [Myxococcales bacterium]